MENVHQLRPRDASPRAEQTIVEVSAAIELVALGLARRIVIANLAAADDDVALARVEADRLGVALDLTPLAAPGVVSVVVGPRRA